MKLEAKDLVFLCRQTGLTDDKLISLLMEDEDLVLEAVSNQSIDDSILMISFPLYTKMVILHHTVDQPFSKDEKEYVANTVTSIYPKVHYRSPYITDRLSIQEIDAQFYLVLAGLFPAYLERLWSKGAPAPQFYIKVAQIGFQRAARHNVAEHTFEWVSILNQTRKHFK